MRPLPSSSACGDLVLFIGDLKGIVGPAQIGRPQEQHVSKTWEYYGLHDPYYGVLSAPEFSAAHLTPEARARFFASGVDKVDRALMLAEEAFGPVGRGVALDYGCGAGRLTHRLNDHFKEVVAVDISPGMLKLAKENLAGRNVAFEEAQAMTDRPVDFIVSMLVMQHIPPKVGVQVIEKLARRLAGTGIIDMPVRYTGGVLRRTLRAAKQLLKAVVPIGRPTIPMHVYDSDAVLAVLRAAGCEVQISTFDAPLHTKANVIFRRLPRN
jgi:SAM-dependent methyltransferase